VITKDGKSIIGKYLLGQAPAYASYFALGCGPTPLETSDTEEDFSLKKNLDFEMFRVPISSRGFVNEGGVDKVVFTAELPTEERYEISEVGLYSAGSNPSAGVYDSKTIFAFTSTENWQYSTSVSTAAINLYSSPLDDPEDDNVIAIEDPVFQTNADNKIFTNSNRVSRYERCRFLNNIFAISGNNANISINSSGNLIAETGSNFIQLSNASVDFSKNSPTDELRLAFSVVNKVGASLTLPKSARVIVEFSSTGSFKTGKWAIFEAVVDDTNNNFATNRYFVVKKQLQQLQKSPEFSWAEVKNVRVYASVMKDNSGVPTSDFYVCLDGLRLENVTSNNSVYGLTGYSVIKTPEAKTIIKSANTTNYIEFRFGLDVL